MSRPSAIAALLIATSLSLARPAAVFSQDAQPTPSRSPARQAIGLALGGGGARGIAHIGLLRWFDEHRIPVDYIAGTSIGALVAAAFATGLSPGEVQGLVVDADWDLMLLADSPFAFKTFRRKEDARAFPGQFYLGLKGGLKLPSALNSGQQVQLLLDRIALPYSALDNFDALPTPFRCVATDIGKAESIVLRSGSLSDAVRASMAIPGVFRPVVLDGRLLVDGGALNNVPADVVKAMGASVVIAVNVSSRYRRAKASQHVFRYFLETPDFITRNGDVERGPRDVPQAEADGSWFASLGERHRLFLTAAGGTSFGHDAGFNRFRLGGPLRLGALNIDELQGNRFVVGVAGLLRQWFRLPNGLGTSAYMGSWIEQGTAFDRWRDAEYHGSVSVGVLLETLIGPASMAYSQSLTGGGRFYVSIGSFLR